MVKYLAHLDELVCVYCWCQNFNVSIQAVQLIQVPFKALSIDKVQNSNFKDDLEDTCRERGSYMLKVVEIRCFAWQWIYLLQKNIQRTIHDALQSIKSLLLHPILDLQLL